MKVKVQEDWRFCNQNLNERRQQRANEQGVAGKDHHRSKKKQTVKYVPCTYNSYIPGGSVGLFVTYKTRRAWK